MENTSTMDRMEWDVIDESFQDFSDLDTGILHDLHSDNFLPHDQYFDPDLIKASQAVSDDVIKESSDSFEDSGIWDTELPGPFPETELPDEKPYYSELLSPPRTGSIIPSDPPSHFPSTPSLLLSDHSPLLSTPSRLPSTPLRLPWTPSLLSSTPSRSRYSDTPTLLADSSPFYLPGKLDKPLPRIPTKLPIQRILRFHTCPKLKCAAGFETSEQLEEHEQKKHPRYLCEVAGCSKSIEGFTDASTLRRHRQAKHEGIKYPCACGDVFERKENMKRHERICKRRNLTGEGSKARAKRREGLKLRGGLRWEHNAH